MRKLLAIVFTIGTLFLNFNSMLARTFSKDGIYYETIDDSRVIVIKNPDRDYSGGICIPEEVSIVGEEGGFEVVGIKFNAFINCHALSSVNMENCHIVELPRFLFFNCQGLKNVYFPRSLKLIDSESFFNCNSINVLAIPEGAEFIEDFAFAECHNLEAVYLPNSLRYLGKSAFRNCDKLVNVILPDDIELVKESCFENCSSLKHVFLGDKIKKIGKFAFKNCTRLENINFPSSLRTIRLSAFARSDSIKEVCIPESVEELSSTSFGYCFGIRKVIFEGHSPPKKFVYDAFAYPDSPFPNLKPVEVIVPEGTIKKFKGKIEHKIMSGNCKIMEENEIALYP